jgi:hypothetical protein
MSGFASGIKGLFGKKPKPVPVITMAGPDPENAQNEVVFAGHGAFNPEVDGHYNGGRVRLPVGVTICFWCRHGESLANEIGTFVESHKDLRALPQHLMERVQALGKSTEIPEIVHGGQEVWNYRLTYPSGLSLGNVSQVWTRKSRYNGKAGGLKGPKTHTEPKGVVADRRFCIVPPLDSRLHVAERGVPIVALLAAHWNICNGATIHWCACRVIRTDRGPAPLNPRL